MRSDVVLGIDLATSALRVTAVDITSGERLGFTGRPLAEPERHESGRSRQRADYHQRALAAIADTTRALGDRAREIVGICVTGTSGTVVGIGPDGRGLGDAALYDDTAADLCRLDGFGAGRAVAGRMAMIAAETNATTLGFTPDVVAAALLGHPVPADTSHALKAGIDAEHRSWPGDLMAAAGVRPEQLPELVWPGEVLGHVGADLAAELGLPSGVAVVAGMTDGCTAQIAAGAVNLGDTLGVLGTTLVVKGVAQEEISTADDAVYSHRAPDGNYWPGGASNVGAGFLATIADRAQLAELDQAAWSRGPSSVVCYPLVGVGERFPVANRSAKFWTSGEPLDLVDRYRSALEGIAFTERFALQRLSELGVSTGRHRLGGGGSASVAWNRIRATVIGQPVLVPAAAGSGYGAAAMVAATVGGEPLAVVIDRWAGDVAVAEPDDAQRDGLDANYQRWCELLTPEI